MINEFSRTEMLIGSENLEKLKNTKIAVFGAGGVGGYTIEALARSGIQYIDIIDNDVISLTNINRQIYALHSTIGMKKIDVAKQRILDINPNATVKTFDTFYLPENANQFDFSKYDYIIDAIDTVVGKIELVMQANKSNTPIISSMGAGNKLNPTQFEVDDIFNTSVCPLAKVMRQELKKRGIKKLKVVYSKEIPLKPIETDAFLEEIKSSQKQRIPASSSFVPSVVGLIIASEVIKDVI